MKKFKFVSSSSLFFVLSGVLMFPLFTFAQVVPGGSDTNVQFNDGGSFGGDSAFTWDKTNNILGLTVSDDHPPLQILTNHHLVDVGAIKLWSNADDSTEKLLSAGDGSSTFNENAALYANGYMSMISGGAVGYDDTVLHANGIGFQAAESGTSALTASDTGLFSSAQTTNDGRIYGFMADMHSTDGGGILIKGTGSTNSSELGKHLTIWGNTTGNANKAISVGNGTSFSENFYLLNNGVIGAGVWNGTVIDPTYGGTGVNNGSNTLTLANNLTTSGNFPLTLTTTAATNITLPTSGTLASLSLENTFSNPVNNFISGTNSTVHIGADGIPGCIVMGDSDGSGVTYITANNGVISATTTPPGNCN